MENVIDLDVVRKNLEDSNFTGCELQEGVLILAELLIKSGAGYHNSHTEECYLSKFKMLKSDRTPNKIGREFLAKMFYKHSNCLPPIFRLMAMYRGN